MPARGPGAVRGPSTQVAVRLFEIRLDMCSTVGIAPPVYSSLSSPFITTLASVHVTLPSNMIPVTVV